MDSESIRLIAREAALIAARESIDRQEAETRQMMADTVRQTLTQLGISHDNPLEVQKDMQHLRAWRLSMEGVQNKTMLTMVGIALSGLVALVLLGFKEFIAK